MTSATWETVEDGLPAAPTADQQPLTAIGTALKRQVTVVGPVTWSVAGDLHSDLYRAYQVTLNGDRYHCDCHDHLYGEKRRRTGCSHVTAVVLLRKRDAAKAKALAVVRAEQDVVVEPSREDVPAPGDARFGQPPFPSWVQGFRNHQWDTIEQVTAAYAEGAKVVVLQAPTGTGKSLIGETVRREVGGKALYICSTKTLQHQFREDFPYGSVLKGRANYLPAGGAVDTWGRRTEGRSSVTCADCTSGMGGEGCRWCDEVMACPYRVARDNASASRLAILNTAYFLTDAGKGQRRFSGRDLTVVDEADLLEGELLGQKEVHISQGRAKALGMLPPERKTVETTWLPWVTEEAIPRVKRRLAQLAPAASADPRELRERKSLTELLERLYVLARELPEGGWVFDGYQRGDITFRPVRVDGYGPELLWQHAQRFLLMSASIISADEMAQSLGLVGDWRLIDVPMTFPARNRPIHIVALVEMKAKERDTAWPKMAEGVAGVLRLHPDERVLVHTVSYELAEHIRKALPPSVTEGRVIRTYTNAKGRDDALAGYLASPNAVLLAPSMDRGVDLPDDKCRVQVVCKIPFPNLGDKRTSARLHTPGGQAWYAVNTVRTLIQMTGRGVRSDDDYATTYILDHTFTSNIWRKSKHLLPKWWCDAVDWRFPVRRLFFLP